MRNFFRYSNYRRDMTTSTSPSAVPNVDPRDRYLMHADARLRYRDEGHGPAVILLHGWTLDLEMWEPQVAALEGAFRLVRFDRRGHGLSSGHPDTRRDTADLAALLRHLDLSRVSLIGMSQGARAALGFASAAPTQVSALILDGPPAMETADSDDIPLGEFRRLAQTQGIEAFRRQWGRTPLMQLRTPDTRGRELLAAMLQRYPGTDLLYPDTSGSVAAPAVHLQSVIAPALIVLGEYDLPSRAQAARVLCTRLPLCERAVIADAGHLPNLDKPDVYNNLCRAFLARHGSPRA
jgi:3-oxoadipate enol-lactonase